MTVNMTHMQNAAKLVSQMISFVQVYEAGKVTGPVDFEYDLTPTQITELKQAFATARTLAISELQAVTG